jgi:hypothetical protein
LQQLKKVKLQNDYQFFLAFLLIKSLASVDKTLMPSVTSSLAVFYLRRQVANMKERDIKRWKQRNK